VKGYFFVSLLYRRFLKKFRKTYFDSSHKVVESKILRFLEIKMIEETRENYQKRVSYQKAYNSIYTRKFSFLYVDC